MTNCTRRKFLTDRDSTHFQNFKICAICQKFDSTHFLTQTFSTYRTDPSKIREGILFCTIQLFNFSKNVSAPDSKAIKVGKQKEKEKEKEEGKYKEKGKEKKKEKERLEEKEKEKEEG